MTRWDTTAVVGASPEDREWMRGEQRFYCPPIVAPNAVLRAFVTVDGGTERATRVGSGCLLLAKSHVGHDAILGERVELATGAVVGGFAEIGDDAKIGLNAVVLPYRKVGAGAIVGAGSVVTRDVALGTVVAGNPARYLREADAPSVPYTERVPTCG